MRFVRTTLGLLSTALTIVTVNDSAIYCTIYYGKASFEIAGPYSHGSPVAVASSIRTRTLVRRTFFTQTAAR